MRPTSLVVNPCPFKNTGKNGMKKRADRKTKSYVLLKGVEHSTDFIPFLMSFNNTTEI